VRSGGEYEVPAGETILDVLRRHGVETRSSCELGYCGACLTGYVAGEVDHRDPILNETARTTHLLICCSRAKSEELVLDLYPRFIHHRDTQGTEKRCHCERSEAISCRR